MLTLRKQIRHSKDNNGQLIQPAQLLSEVPPLEVPQMSFSDCQLQVGHQNQQVSTKRDTK
jgi:hypothetical protein